MHKILNFNIKLNLKYLIKGENINSKRLMCVVKSGALYQNIMLCMQHIYSNCEFIIQLILSIHFDVSLVQFRYVLSCFLTTKLCIFPNWWQKWHVCNGPAIIRINYVFTNDELWQHYAFYFLDITSSSYSWIQFSLQSIKSK
jgi:hypothetical protein